MVTESVFPDFVPSLRRFPAPADAKLRSRACVSRCLLALAALAGSGTAQTTPYTTPPTNTRRTVTNFNVETVRGMALDPVLPRLWAINTHNSTLVGFDLTFPPPPPPAQAQVRFRTIQNPVALQLWDPSAEKRFAIIVGGGTHGVVKQNRDTGAIEDYLQLPSEPMDVVIDTQRDRAFVSCAGAFDLPTSPGQNPVSGGVVVEIDLASFAFAGANGGHHFIDAARPTFLNIEMGPGTNDNVVFVTPFLSGNNTTFQLLSAGDAVVQTGAGLPDDDLFTISESGVVASALSGAGTLLTAHARNPVTSEYWILGVDLLNAAHHEERDHRGRFANNQVTLANLGTLTHATKSLDGPPVPGGPPALRITTTFPVSQPSGSPHSLWAPTPFSPDKPASFPFGLTFLPPTLGGFAFVVSSTGDTLRILAPSGDTLRCVELPEGAIPRGVQLTPANDFLFVYAWGSNRIYAYGVGQLFLGSSADPVAVFELGEDPLPAAVRRGRKLWYDADNSLDTFASVHVRGKVSCNTCHPRGGTDLLGWELSDAPSDRKDLMVTQSLLSIEDTFPYHWRGERSLSDFNVAFPGLLGGTELDSVQLADFEAFVFSLQAPANPRQHLDRRLDPQRNPIFGQVIDQNNNTYTATGNAVIGQTLFHNDTNALLPFNPVRCVDCHGGEAGTTGVITADVTSILPTEAHLDVAHLRQLGHKFFQSQVATTFGLRPRGGFGFSQDGDDNDILDFLDVFFFPPPNATPADFQVNIQKRADTASFVAQFDEGIAPRAHRGFLFDVNHPTLAELQVMMSAAVAGSIDLVLIGHLGATPIGAWFDTSTASFHTAEVGHPFGLSAKVLTLETLRSTNSVRFLVMGVPPGNGFRFAVDFDADGLSNTTEVNPAFFVDSDTDRDGLPDGYELSVPGLDPRSTNHPLASVLDTTAPTITSVQHEFTNGRIAKYLIQFSEPASYVAQAERRVPGSVPAVFQPVGPPQVHPAVRTIDTLVVHHLLPSDPSSTQSEEFRVRVTPKDWAGNQPVVPYVLAANPIHTRPFVFRDGINAAGVVSNFAVQPRSGGTPVSINLSIQNLTSTPPPGQLPPLTAVVQVLTQPAGGGDFSELVSANPTGSTILEPALEVDFNGQIVHYGTIAGPPVIGPTDGLVDGPFLLTTLNSNGTGTVDFTLPNTLNNRPIRVVHTGLFFPQVNPGASPPRFTSLSLLLWQTAMTPTDLRKVEFVY